MWPYKQRRKISRQILATGAGACPVGWQSNEKDYLSQYYCHCDINGVKRQSCFCGLCLNNCVRARDCLISFHQFIG
ncbi:hypothetical protein HZ326_24286 [Fusarium oxysporum f. sp. albedinis]|nr:hypothetical protein HZ326_24286 [Fusarium oxysporum f. sp. albedinis]